MPYRTDRTISPADGLELATTTWDDVSGTPRGVVQLVHGLAEYTARYDRFARALNAAGFVVSGADTRGHGGSVSATVPLGSFGVPGAAGFFADTAAYAGRLARQYPDLPLFAFAHSLGSMCLQNVLINDPVPYAGVVLSGTTTLDGLIAVVQGLAADPDAGEGLAGFNAGFEQRTGFEWLSRDAAEVDAYVADPLCGFATEDAVLGGILATAERTADPAALGRIRSDLPLLLVSGDADPVGGRGGAHVTALAERYRSAGLADVTVNLYPGARHELVNETNRDEVTADVVAWLESHLPS
ncbi:Lysophospholipase, alpha-beta hydrolase superfamily [Quadrisphaera granulorum]|uniref:Alpha-beta hydrolase superfamily lysophospholipase n=1 Tax=Quadrisphaera granulorum TaxID=317664 RepID=A0A316A7B9_9ACTN|nr:alpha/beta hydrolase [Quadrisphaera granulorum]PWJ53615.1 alpha-beta hydrolase superfamily lysophospholipase [Quadrisphaera granulorum]SZE96659.1 Lysophospholipase, alpha-beta hydrolase superfamily [Quadrisphaera granulorum]